MDTREQLPEGFRYVSIRFQSRFNSRFFAPVTPDPRVLPELSRFDSAEQRKEKLARHERHFRKLGARIRRDTAITGKAGRKPEPETVEKRISSRENRGACGSTSCGRPQEGSRP